MKNWFSRPDANEMLARIDKLPPSAAAQWGKFTVSEALWHLTVSVRVPIGEAPVQPKNTPIGLPVLSTLVIWVLPWPRSAPTAPEYLPQKGMTDLANFESDKLALRAALGRFSEYPQGKMYEPHPAFGKLGRASWGRLMWRHVDHHLRQFGV